MRSMTKMFKLSLLLLPYSVESFTINQRVSAKRLAFPTTAEPSTLCRLNVETGLPHRFGTNDAELAEITRCDSTNSGGIEHNRREIFSRIINGSLVASSSCMLPWKAIATEPSNIGIGTPERPIVIIGGGGRTGMAVAEAVAGEIGQMNAVIMTRTGDDPFRSIKKPPTMRARLQSYSKPVDVRDDAGVVAALKEVTPSTVVFVASASKKGGNASDVDDIGVGIVAKAAQTVGAKIILVSALAVDRPESRSFQITNTIGGYMNGIMDAKINGEGKVRSTMSKNNYVIIRPGVLLSGKTNGGVSDIELNQGDTIGGGLSRDELAGVVVGAIQSNKKGFTVEAYRTRTATKLQPEFTVPSGNELRGGTFEELFLNVKAD